MTTSPERGFIPELTLGWRLRMARESTGAGLREFAERIGVAPDTLTSAEKDRRKVRPITINAYVLATGVNKHWLETGEGSPSDPDGDSEVESDALRKLTDAKRARSRKGRDTTDRYLPEYGSAAA